MQRQPLAITNVGHWQGSAALVFAPLAGDALILVRADGRVATISPHAYAKTATVASVERLFSRLHSQRFSFSEVPLGLDSGSAIVGR